MSLVIGVDIAKETHWVTALTPDGRVVLDEAVANEPGPSKS